MTDREGPEDHPLSKRLNDASPERDGLGDAPGALSWEYIAVFVLTVAALLLPLFWMEYIPFVDYPNHVARIYIRAHYDEVPLLRQLYVVRLSLTPYLAMELIATPLARIMSVYLACKLFLAILIVLFCLGCHLLSSTIRGRPTWMAPIACFWVYNSTMQWGFVNYMFGVAVFMIVLACWLRWRHHWTAIRVVTFSVLAVACYLSHLVGYILLAVAVGVICLYDLWTHRISFARTAASIVPILPPIGFFFFWKQSTGDVFQIIWNTPFGKLAAAPNMFRGYNLQEDVVFFMAWVVLVIILACLNRIPRVSTPMVLVSAAFVALFLALPVSVAASGDGAGIDSRFILPGFLVLVFSVWWEPNRRVGIALVTVAMALSVLHLAALNGHWLNLSGRIAQAATLFSAMPEGTRVYPAVFNSTGIDTAKFDSAVMHVLEYGIVEKRILDPGLFEVGKLVEFRKRPRAQQWRPELGASVFDKYDYVWSYREPPELRALLSQKAVIDGESAGFTLWRLRHSGESDAKSLVP